MSGHFFAKTFILEHEQWEKRRLHAWGIALSKPHQAISRLSSFSDRSPQDVEVYDTTLRDGNQSVGVNFTWTQKLKVAQTLIVAGVDYVEGGWPNATNPTELAFFTHAKSLSSKDFSHVTAFGMTRRANTDSAEDGNLSYLLQAGTGTVTIFGKSWAFQVEKVLKTTLDENRRMIRDSVGFLRSRGRKVIYDAEHFFDGFRADRDYALSTLRAAEDGGASALVLCDTRGGSYPSEVYETTKYVLERVRLPVGVHCHDDRGMATSNTLFGVMAGATHVQGTMNGLGERVGNADLVEVVANLNLMGVNTGLQASRLTSISRFISEISGVRENPFKPFVGKYAFAHKGGVHADAVLKADSAYEFFDPSAFGNGRAITVSSQAGRSSLLAAAERFGFKLSRDDRRLLPILQSVKRLESQGCNLENAEASLELLIRRTLGSKREPFRVWGWELSVQNDGKKSAVLCKVNVKVNGEPLETTAAGNGPVNAFDQALRTVLSGKFGSRFTTRLTGYRVKEIDSESGTAARVAVYIDFSDNHRTWTTVSSSTNIIQASVDALVDGYAYSFKAMKPALKSKKAQRHRQ